MVEMAQTFNRDRIAKGLIAVQQASSDQIPYPDKHSIASTRYTLCISGTIRWPISGKFMGCVPSAVGFCSRSDPRKMSVPWLPFQNLSTDSIP